MTYEELIVANIEGEDDPLPCVLVHSENRARKVLVWKSRVDGDQPFSVHSVEWASGKHTGSDGSVNDPFNFVLLSMSGEFNSFEDAIRFARMFART